MKSMFDKLNLRPQERRLVVFVGIVIFVVVNVVFVYPIFGDYGKTNAFIEEQSVVISVNTVETNLVDFMYSLCSENSLIRVRSMTLQPEPARFRLQGSMTLVESFQRKPPARAAATTATKSTPP